MLSSGMFSALAASIAVRSRALPAGSPPPCFAAMVISRISLVKSAPRRASVTAFLRLICFHLLWPAMGAPVAGYALHVPRPGALVQRATWTVQRRSNLQLDHTAPPQVGYRPMNRPRCALVALVLFAACERAGEGAADRELAAAALRDVLAFPGSAVVSVSAGQDAAQAAFTTPAALQNVAAWYRLNLKLNDWEIKGDQLMADGAIAIYAVRRGKPLWITLQRSSGGAGGAPPPVGTRAPPAPARAHAAGGGR